MDLLIRILIIACLLVGLLDLVLLAIILWTRYVKGQLVVLEARMERIRQERDAARQVQLLAEVPEATLRKIVGLKPAKKNRRKS